MFRILIVEDDAGTRKLMEETLRDAGYDTISARDGIEALDILDEKHADAMIVDVMMPRLGGYELTRELREAGIEIPILMVTAREARSDMREGFTSGADDYMTKPVDEEEMLLRLSALLRRARAVSEKKLEVGGTTLRYDSLSVEWGDTSEQLPKKEFQLLYRLLSYPNRIFTRSQLMDELWDPASESDERTVNVHISRLRDRFRSNPDFEIVTVRGLGYKAVPKN